MKDFWNERYSEEGYAYGTVPNQYFAKKLIELNQIKIGRLLLAAEGEGRNALCAALMGWRVSAFDISEVAQQKALQMAEEYEVEINYQVGGLEQVEFKAASFDALGLIYAHFPPNIRKQYHLQLANFLKPGGHLILEAFSKNHLSYREKDPAVGGPPIPEILFSIEEIKDEFPNFDFLELSKEVIELAEGKYHNGTASVIRCFARKQ